MSIITFSANIMFSVDGSINGFLLLSTLFSLAIGCVNTYVGITKLIKIHELYRQHKNDEKKYKEEVVRLYKAEEAYDEYMKQGIKRIYSEKNQNPHNIKCPYCNSYNTKRITVTTRAISTHAFGMASSKIGKQWHCNNCDSDF